MRHRSYITSISWFHSEASEGAERLAFDGSLAHHDPPWPGVLEHAEQLERSSPELLATGHRGEQAPEQV
jgi:hypothetical protein